MRFVFKMVLVTTLICRAAYGVATPPGQWQFYKFAVHDVVLEIAIPFQKLDHLYQSEWAIAYRAPKLELFLSGQDEQLRLFKAPLNLAGPFWLGGVYGVVNVSGYVNRKPDWFKGDLSDIEALSRMKDRHLKEFGRTNKWRVEVVAINGQLWVHWFDYDHSDPKFYTVTPRHDRYTRPVNEFLYLDVMIDTTKAAVSDDLNWLKDAALVVDTVRNSLFIKYPKTMPATQG